MFILRTVEDVQMLRKVGEEGEPLPISTDVRNIIIGNDYEVIKQGSSKYSNYLHEYGFDTYESHDEVMFLTSSSLKDELILRKDENISYYIMTESGKTFEKL